MRLGRERVGEDDDAGAAEAEVAKQYGGRGKAIPGTWSRASPENPRRRTEAPSRTRSGDRTESRAKTDATTPIDRSARKVAPTWSPTACIPKSR